ncbi:MAG: GTPase ObgE [Anaeroplasmataceae bacterium]|nr:GTPase ObgE [Anaeroplasmataceae bacterium]MDE6414257.1 GTPase ObgE [Anaeroplasmataceae bacterium]
MFVDLVKMELEAGRGGDGIVAYRRELKVEKGGPFGGNGGNGGSIIFVGEEGLSTLLDLRYNKIIKGTPGEKGAHKGMTGANALDTYIKVPVGTIIFDETTGRILGDITKHKQEVLVCKGGRGGRGNMAFATGTLKCPDFCEKGEPGEKKTIRCELKVLADCGLVGFPSVGKSTLIAAVSKARPKIAEYHFTTLVPNLGMVEVADGRNFVMADLPGIIEGAHQGAGLGLQFLRHIERCRVIVHIIDMAATDGRDPYSDYLIINQELASYKMNLTKRPQIIVANKMDMEAAKENLKEFKKKVKEPIIEISAYTKQNLNELLYKIADILAVTPEFSLFEDEEIEEVEYGIKEEEPFFTIEKQNDGVYNVTGTKLKRLFDMTDFDSDYGRMRFARQLRTYGLDDSLRKLGVQNGDTVRIFDFEFEFVD